MRGRPQGIHTWSDADELLHFLGSSSRVSLAVSTMTASQATDRKIEKQQITVLILAFIHL
jgi:hypothetical protein